MELQSTATVVPSISDANISSATSDNGICVPFTGLVNVSSAISAVVSAVVASVVTASAVSIFSTAAVSVAAFGSASL